MSYEVRTRDLSGIKLSGYSAKEYYDDNFEYHINPKYVSYGDVLVSTKRVKVGFTLKLKILYRRRFYWKPEYRFRPNWGECYFHWLFFMFWFEFNYDDIMDKIVKDHLSEFKNSQP